MQGGNLVQPRIWPEKWALTCARELPAGTLQGIVIGSCHVVFNSAFFRAGERNIKEDSVKPPSHIKRVTLNANFSWSSAWFFCDSHTLFLSNSGELSEKHVLLSEEVTCCYCRKWLRAEDQDLLQLFGLWSRQTGRLCNQILNHPRSYCLQVDSSSSACGRCLTRWF